MQHVRVENPISSEKWQKFMLGVEPEITFHNHVSAFQGPQRVNIADKLKQILDDFGAQGLTAVFAVRHGMVEGLWIDPNHNYLATVFSKATGDDDDFVMINSLSGRSADRSKARRLPGTR